MSGSRLYAASAFSGAGLSNCTGTNKLLWDSTTQRFSCAADANSTYTAGQGLTLSTTSFRLNTTITGSVVNFQTVSGSTVYAKNTLASSGSLKVLGVMSGGSLTVDRNASISGALLVKGNIATKATVSGANFAFMGGNSYVLGNLGIGKSATPNTKLEVAGTISGALVTQNGPGNNYFLGNVGIGRTNPTQKLEVQGSMSGSRLYAASAFSGAGLTDCTAGNKLIWSASTQRFSCVSDAAGATYYAGQGLNLTGGNSFQLNTTITGSVVRFLTISGSTVFAKNTLASSGTLKVLGAMSGGSLTVDRNAAISGALTVKGNIKGKSNISGSTLTVDGNVTLHGQTYNFPVSQTANGVLKTDGAGNLTWSTNAGTGSGNILSFQPEYPNAVYFASGASAVGQLFGSGGTAGKEQVYRWTSSKTAMNDYWIGVRVRVPDNFSSWINTALRKPIELRYRTGSGQSAAQGQGSYVTVKMTDTTGANVALTSASNLANTAYTTATITGPEGAGTWTRGGYFNIYVKLASSTTVNGNWFAEASFLNINWLTTSP
jgi:cytoskeletal protein CcmA (bactofilin family)